MIRPPSALEHYIHGEATAVLNRRLYSLLRATFGPVRISNPGEAAIPGPPFHHAESGEFRAGFAYRGEHYAVRCPFCADHKARLSICHLWNTPDPYTGRRMDWLANCFNEQCTWDHNAELMAMVFGFKNHSVRVLLESMRVEPGIVIDLEPGPVELPGEILPLADLGPDHPALRYVHGRGFDMAELAATWDVAFCRRGVGPTLPAGGRILIPVHFRGERVGWQARYVGTVTKESRIPKYLTLKGFSAKRTLYNYDRARASRVVVVCEGVTDVWAVGPEAVGLFGKTISARQVELLGDWVAEGGLVVLCLDPDAWEEEGAEQKFSLDRLKDQLKGRLVAVRLPDARDPGDYERATLWRLIGRACADQGFPLEGALAVPGSG
jgi:hypothetical protein